MKKNDFFITLFWVDHPHFATSLWKRSETNGVGNRVTIISRHWWRAAGLTFRFSEINDRIFPSRSINLMMEKLPRGDKIGEARKWFVVSYFYCYGIKVIIYWVISSYKVGLTTSVSIGSDLTFGGQWRRWLTWNRKKLIFIEVFPWDGDDGSLKKWVSNFLPQIGELVHVAEQERTMIVEEREKYSVETFILGKSLLSEERKKTWEDQVYTKMEQFFLSLYTSHAVACMKF